MSETNEDILFREVERLHKRNEKLASDLAEAERLLKTVIPMCGFTNLSPESVARVEPARAFLARDKEPRNAK